MSEGLQSDQKLDASLFKSINEARRICLESTQRFKYGFLERRVGFVKSYVECKSIIVLHLRSNRIAQEYHLIVHRIPFGVRHLKSATSTFSDVDCRMCEAGD